jgi:hypothetical protein
MTCRRFFSVALFVVVILALCFVPGTATHFGFAGVVLAARPKKLGTLNFTSGGGDKLTTGNGLILARYKGFVINFTATFNKAGAGSFGTLASEAPFNLFRDVRLYGKSLLQKSPLRFLRQLNHKYLQKTDASFSAPTATNTNQTIQFSVYVDAISRRTNFEDGSIFDLSKNVSSPSLEVDFGTVEDLISGGDYTTKAIVNATCTVFGVIDENPTLKNFRFSDREVRFIDTPTLGSGTTEFVAANLPLGRSINRMLIGQYTPNPEVLIATAILAGANIRVDVNGKPVWGPYTFQEIQRWNLADTNGLGLDTGYIVVDFLRHGFNLKDTLDLTNTLDTRDPERVTGAQLIVDTQSVSNARLAILVDGLVPPFLQKSA